MNNLQTKTLDQLNLFFDNAEINSILKIIKLVNNDSIEFEKWYYVNENKKIKLIVLNKSNSGNDVKEYHKLNTDFHITIKGKDKIYIGNSDFIEIDNKIMEDDYCLVKAKTINEISVNENELLMINPEVVHCNILEKESIKMVIKKQNG